MTILCALNSPTVEAMMKYIGNHDGLNSGQFSQGKYVESPPEYIAVEPMRGASALDCWNNVAHAAGDLNLGVAITGWALWRSWVTNTDKSEDQVYMAQPHVVLQKFGGRLVDITPHARLYEGNTVFFAKDCRVGYDHKNKVQPAALTLRVKKFGKGIEHFSWVSRDKDGDRDILVDLPNKISGRDNYDVVTI